MARCGCVAASTAGCQCAFDDSTCVNVIGVGSPGDPIIAQLTVDPDPRNLAECGASGLLVTLPGSLADPPTVQLRHDTDFSIPSGGWTVMPFNTELWDDGAMHVGAFNERITFPVDGIYTVGVRIGIEADTDWDVATGGYRAIRLTKNVVGDTLDEDIVSYPGTLAVSLHIRTLVAATAGEVVHVEVFQNSNGALLVQAAPFWTPKFEALWERELAS